MMKQLAKATLVSAMLLSGATLPAFAQEVPSSVRVDTLKAKKKTSLGLYVTAKDAYNYLKNNKKAVLIDVRTPEETMFVGMPERANVNIPFMLVDYTKFDPKKKHYAMKLNPDFSTQVDHYLQTAGADEFTPVFFMCRSGGRSAKAVSKISELGYDVAYSVVDGFEGDKDRNGRRTVNGWKNAGLPWSYKLKANQTYKAARIAATN